MCTVTYIPKPNSGFLFTSNRDELTGRGNTRFPVRKMINGNELVFPQDELSQGTWIIGSDKGTVACILNGAFTGYEKQRNYRHSRGLIPLMLFEYENVLDFWRNFDTADIEPFTLLVVEGHGLNLVHDLRWDGKKRHAATMDGTEPLIWSSNTLYQSPVIKKRERWFNEFLKAERLSKESVLRFHHEAGDGDPENDLIMKREFGLATVSITNIDVSDTSLSMVYENLWDNTIMEENLLI